MVIFRLTQGKSVSIDEICMMSGIVDNADRMKVDVVLARACWNGALSQDDQGRFSLASPRYAAWYLDIDDSLQPRPPPTLH